MTQNHSNLVAAKLLEEIKRSLETAELCGDRLSDCLPKGQRACRKAKNKRVYSRKSREF